jgi:hypothetical protein
MRCVPLSVNSETLPSAPRGTITWFAMVWPAAAMLRFEASGRGRPDGHTVTNPAPVAPVAVTVNTTAETPWFGTPQWSLTASFTVLPAAGASTRTRVSRRRVGRKGEHAPGSGIRRKRVVARDIGQQMGTTACVQRDRPIACRLHRDEIRPGLAGGIEVDVRSHRLRRTRRPHRHIARCSRIDRGHV